MEQAIETLAEGIVWIGICALGVLGVFRLLCLAMAEVSKARGGKRRKIQNRRKKLPQRKSNVVSLEQIKQSKQGRR